MSGVEFLVAAHRLHPAAKRVLLVERGDYSTSLGALIGDPPDPGLPSGPGGH